jgi:hypothetical protein
MKIRIFHAMFLALAIAIPAGRATPTIWNGPVTLFSKADGADPFQAANQDRLTSNVWITRGGTEGLFNAKTEGGFTHFLSPSGTTWANGTTANYSSLSYTDWNDWAKGVNPGPPSTVGINAVVHLVSEDIYFNIKFTSWSTGGGGFSYQRSTPSIAPEPSAAMLALVGLAAGGVGALKRRSAAARVKG